MRDAKSHLSDAERERLALLIEECAEIQQIACKILRHGYDSYHPDDPNKSSNAILLERELGDLGAVVRLMTQRMDIIPSRVDEAGEQKMRRAEPYLHYNTFMDML